MAEGVFLTAPSILTKKHQMNEQSIVKMTDVIRFMAYFKNCKEKQILKEVKKR
ncbi:hypothetical protein CMALT430_40101 [Carnobacterium maltaromaticum]|nr:hypothetical protein CMALT430_40101 [Carnobacterium maltaromaticum]